MAAQAPPDPEPGGHGLFDRILSFIAALRAAGVNATQSEAIDAFRVVQHIDIVDRAVFREALGAVLVTSTTDRRTFDELFDLWFPVRLGDGTGGEVDPDLVDEDGEVDRDAFMEALVNALMDGDDEALRRMARQAVDGFGRVEGRNGEPSWFSYRVRRNLDPRHAAGRLAVGPRRNRRQCVVAATVARRVRGPPAGLPAGGRCRGQAAGGRTPGGRGRRASHGSARHRGRRLLSHDGHRGRRVADPDPPAGPQARQPDPGQARPRAATDALTCVGPCGDRCRPVACRSTRHFDRADPTSPNCS